MASFLYNAFVTRQLGGTLAGATATPINFIDDTIKVALVTSSYTADQDAHDFFNDVTNEVTGTGYTAGGATLGTKTVDDDATDNEGVADAADTTWPSSTITAAAAVVYKDTGVTSTSPLIAYIDFSGNKISTNGTFQITWASEGIVNITVVSS